MLELITLEQARYQCYIDSDGGPHDPWLTEAIQEISEAVALWLKDEWRLYVAARDSNGDTVTDSAGNPVPAEDSSGPIVHPAVRRAVKLEVASQFRFREGEGDNDMPATAGHGYVLSKAATAILTPLRRPTVS